MVDLVQSPQDWNVVVQRVNRPFEQVAHQEEQNRLLPQRSAGQRLMRAGTERILETGCDCPERQRDWQVEQDAVNEGVRKIRGESAPDQRLSDARTKVPCRRQ